MYLAFCRKSASTVIVDKYDPSSNLYGTTENKIIILIGQRGIFIIKVWLFKLMHQELYCRQETSVVKQNGYKGGYATVDFV